MKTVRRIAVLVFVVWFVVSSFPLPLPNAIAAPPESEGALLAVSQDGRSRDGEEGTSPDHDRVPALAGAADESGSERTRPDKAPAQSTTDRGSVRPRGLEAPVQLRQQGPDPLDGVVEEAKEQDREARKQKPSKTKDRKQKTRDRPERGIRVWPMPAETYTFTQAFGCVPQIAHFYQPGAGCPADAPVIHHGIDMAAPEGTLFYAAASGWVTEAGYDREVGVANTRIIIQHDDRNEAFATEYLHWIASYVDVGDYVEAGQAIGEVGSVGYSTGPHLHFTVIDLENGGNLDPVAWLPDEPGTEGYLGKLPDTRTEMRLPAGTTAGVPEWHDPSPPPPPERQEVPASPPERDRSERKRKKDKDKDKKARKERRAEKRAAKKNRADATAETAGDTETAKADSNDKKVQGKNKERTRKRERANDGQDDAKAANGEDGKSKRNKEKRDKAKRDAKRDKAKDTNRGDKKSSKNKKRNKDKVDQRDSTQRGKGNKGNKGKNKDNGNPEEAPPANDDGSNEVPVSDEPPVDDGQENPGDEDRRDGGSGDETPSESPSDVQDNRDAGNRNEKRRDEKQQDGDASNAPQQTEEKRGDGNGRKKSDATGDATDQAEAPRKRKNKTQE